MLESINPANPTEVVASFPQCSPADVDDAVSAAVTAQPSWEELGIIKRGSILREVADLMTVRREELAALMTQEQGKTYPEALGEIDGSAETIRYHAASSRNPMAKPTRLLSLASTSNKSEKLSALLE